MNGIPPRSHGITFEDNSFLSYKELTDQAAELGCQHSVVVHDSGLALDMYGHVEGDNKPQYFGVSVTQGGFTVANTSRCWLYDGLFTPLILDALNRSTSPMCAEDLINFAIRALGPNKTFKPGAFHSHVIATAKSFFVPLEASVFRL